jgi:hypothetical protein
MLLDEPTLSLWPPALAISKTCGSSRGIGLQQMTKMAVALQGMHRRVPGDPCPINPGSVSWILTLIKTAPVSAWLVGITSSAGHRQIGQFPLERLWRSQRKDGRSTMYVMTEAISKQSVTAAASAKFGFIPHLSARSKKTCPNQW